MPYYPIRDFKARFDPLVIAYLAEKSKRARELTNNPLLLSLTDHVRALYAGDGKRLRPYMAYLGYATTGGENPDALLGTFGAFELIHTYLLVHDDIIDHGTLRHEVPTIHTKAKDLMSSEGRIGDIAHVGVSHAIVFGDLLSIWGHELFDQAAATVGYEATHRARQQLVPLIEEVGYGEMLDVDGVTWPTIEDEDLLNKTFLKTATYSFMRPAQAGIALGPSWNNSEIISFANRYGKELGIGFQIQGDYLDIIGDNGKTPWMDAVERQHTAYTQFIRQHGTVAEQEKLESHLGKELDETTGAELRSLYHESGAVSHGLRIAHEYFERAHAIASAAPLAEPERQPWIDLVDKISTRTR